MKKAIEIKGISPAFALPGAEVILDILVSGAVEGVPLVEMDGTPVRIIAASSERLVVRMPDDAPGKVKLGVMIGKLRTSGVEVTIGREIAREMHNVANPAIDPKDGAVVATRSGSRGYQLPNTLYRIEPDGYIDELPVEVMNPTGIAFSPSGDFFVSNRASGEIYTIERGEKAVTYASGLGIATGIAFDADGVLFVGDRTGTIFRVPELGMTEVFAKLEPSVAAYHLAFGPDGRLYVTAPALSSYDAVYAIDAAGGVGTYFRGFGRPQGLAFDSDGALYVAASYGGRRGIVRIAPGVESAELFVAGDSVVGLCFGRDGEMIIATSEAVYSLPVGLKGLLSC